MLHFQLITFSYIVNLHGTGYKRLWSYGWPKGGNDMIRSVCILLLVITFFVSSYSFAEEVLPKHNKDIQHPVDCKIKLFQDGTEITPLVHKNIFIFKLSPKVFRIEVSPLTCSPSIATYNRHEIAYITQTPLIYGNGSYWLAGDSSTADILSVDDGSNNPRTSIEEEIDVRGFDTEWLRQQYNEQCKVLTFCPTPVKHFASAWPFLDPNTQENRGVAIFNRFRENIPLSKVSGRVINTVIYTEWKKIDKPVNNRVLSFFYLLKPHVVVLDFRK